MESLKCNSIYYVIMVKIYHVLVRYCRQALAMLNIFPNIQWNNSNDSYGRFSLTFIPSRLHEWFNY